MKLLSILFTCALFAAAGGLASHLKRANALPVRLNQTSANHFQNSVIDQ